MTVDLHLHSLYSDGSLSPSELVELGSVQGLSALALTDHDTIEGILEAKIAGRKKGIEVISGVELSADLPDCTLHILGYFFDVDNVDLKKGLSELQAERRERNEKIIFRLGELGINIDNRQLQKIAGVGLVGRPHIGKILVAQGVVDSMNEAFDKFLGQFGAAYVSRSKFTVREAVSLIHKAHGLAVLAHPLQMVKSGVNPAGVISRLVRLGLDGIEYYYPTYSKKKRRIIRRYMAGHNIIITGGSDYHGDIRPSTSMAGVGGFSVPDTVLLEMKRRITQKYGI